MNYIPLYIFFVYTETSSIKMELNNIKKGKDKNMNKDLGKNTIAFMTSSSEKTNEFERILGKLTSKYSIKKTNEKLDEPSNAKTLEDLIRKKTIMAFEKYKMPIIVEHTILDISYLNGLPGYLTDYVMKKWNKYTICELMKCCSKNRDAVAKTVIGYCDGKNIKLFEGVTKGKIASMPRGENGFGWDAIFIPDEKEAGEKTFGQMTSNEKDRFSMRTKAISKFAEYLCQNELSFYGNSNQSFNALLEQIKSGNKKLVLFIGAGVPRNIGFSSWNDLLLNIAEENGYDREVANVLTKDPLEMAEFLMKENSIKLQSVFEKEMRADENLNQKIYESLIYRSIVDLKPDKIYTTNYDESLKIGFENQFISIEKQECYMVPEIKKLHGDIKKLEKEGDFEKEIVLTESSYLEQFDKIFDKENVYKELSESLEDENNIVIFLGYGMGDFNIKYILNKLKDRKEKENIYFFTTKPDIVQEKILKGKGINMIYGNNPSPKISLENFLFKLLEAKYKK